MIYEYLKNSAFLKKMDEMVKNGKLLLVFNDKSLIDKK